MTKIFVSFEAENSDELTQLIFGYAMRNSKPPSWVGQPLDAEALEAEEDARERIAEEDARDALDQKGYEEHLKDMKDLEAGSAPEPPAKRARAARTPGKRLLSAANEMLAVARGEAEPVRVSVAPPPVDLPSLDTLKAAVTSAVRLAQKGEGSRAILDLLPAFKDATGLNFVMNSEEKHRGALYDLVQAAGLPIV